MAIKPPGPVIVLIFFSMWRKDKDGRGACTGEGRVQERDDVGYVREGCVQERGGERERDM
jgi:hypothetical protein